VDRNAEGDEAPTLDHIKRVSEGGGNQTSNLRLAHRLCNELREQPDSARLVARADALGFTATFADSIPRRLALAA